MNRDRATLLQIFQAAQLVVSFSDDLEIGDFAENQLTRSAILYQLAIIGEAVKRLSDTFREEHPSVAWSEIAGMRDRIIHGYDTVNFQRVWDAIVLDVPELLRYIKPFVPKEE